MATQFNIEGPEGNVTLYTYDINGKRVDLFAISTIEEAEDVRDRLNAAVVELLGDDEDDNLAEARGILRMTTSNA